VTIHNYRIWATEGEDEPRMIAQTLATSHADALAEAIEHLWCDSRRAALVRAGRPELQTIKMETGVTLTAIRTPDLEAADALL
jgi:hypothetical protein